MAATRPGAGPEADADHGASAVESPSPLQRRRGPLFFAVLSLPSTAMGLALSVQIATLSWILTTRYGLAIHDVGLVWAAGPLAGIIGQVLIGVISDKVWFWGGRRRPFILVGGTLAALMLLALPAIGVISAATGIESILAIAIVVALTLDLAINVSFNPTRSIIADLTRPGAERTKGYTWMQTISGSVSVAGYAVGALFGNLALIYAGAIAVLLCSIVPPFFLREDRALDGAEAGAEGAEAAAEGTEGRASPRAIALAIRPLWAFLLYDVYAMALRLLGVEHRHYVAELACLAGTLVLLVLALVERDRPDGLSEFRKVLAAHAFSWIGIQTTFVFLFAYLQYALAGFDGEQLGRVSSTAFLVLNTVGALLPAFVLMPLARRIGLVNCHTLALACMTAGYVGLARYGTSTTVIYGLMAVVGIGWAAIVSLPFAIMSQFVSRSAMGLYMGLFNLAVVLPQLVVSLGIALFLSRAPDKSVIFVISAAALALSTVAWQFVSKREPE